MSFNPAGKWVSPPRNEEPLVACDVFRARKICESGWMAMETPNCRFADVTLDSAGLHGDYLQSFLSWNSLWICGDKADLGE